MQVLLKGHITCLSFSALLSEKTEPSNILTFMRALPRFHSGRRQGLRVPGTQGEYICSAADRLSIMELRFSVILIRSRVTDPLYPLAHFFHDHPHSSSLVRDP